jgi:hypothetical protein
LAVVAGGRGCLAVAGIWFERRRIAGEDVFILVLEKPRTHE